MTDNLKQVHGWWCTTHQTWTRHNDWPCSNRTTYFDDDPSKPPLRGEIRNRLPCQLTELYINPDAETITPASPEKFINRIEASLTENPYPYTHNAREADLAKKRADEQRD